MSALPTHRRVRNVDRDRREGARLLPSESSRCPLCDTFLACNWSPVVRLAQPVSINGKRCYIVHERCAAKVDDARAAAIERRNERNHLIGDGACLRHSGNPMWWCLECRDLEIDVLNEDES